MEKALAAVNDEHVDSDLPYMFGNRLSRANVGRKTVLAGRVADGFAMSGGGGTGLSICGRIGGDTLGAESGAG